MGNLAWTTYTWASETNDVRVLQVALDTFDKATRMDTTEPAFHHGRALILSKGGHPTLAVQAWRDGLAAAEARGGSPHDPEMFSQLVFAAQGICDWDTYEHDSAKLYRIIMNQLRTGQHPAVSPFRTQMMPVFSALDALRIAQQYAKFFMAQLPRSVPAPFVPQLARGERLRIGYASGVLRNHSMTHLMSAVFKLHDRSKVEVFIYAFNPSDGSEARAAIPALVDHFRDVSGLSNEDAAAVIRADKLHVCVDLNGWIDGARPKVLAMRPAPIQIGYLVFIGSSGAPFIDYTVSDRVASPPHLQHLYTDKLILMPDTYQVNSYRSHFPRHSLPATLTRKELGLPESGTVYCDFNALYKVYPALWNVWMRVLQRVPGSVLWLLRFPPATEDNLKAAAQRLGIAPSRIVFSAKIAISEHLARASACDVMLDTPHYNGGTTTADVLWAGVPALVTSEQAMGCRMGISLLNALGVPELVAPSLTEYEAIAVELGLDPQRRSELRSRVAERRESGALFDTERWVGNWERVMPLVWDLKAAGKGAQHVVLARRN
eukprot:TRINITY_DN6687_c0_g1_i1.p1 TRINITY_DN6687_c0_g1~~TRINITY_DN6687_c0_g1_i1.p1  ORF type:complete len:642 (-),score=139.37 TRINITY_DN6687_c0_g1_i1:1964-3604(-)